MSAAAAPILDPLTAALAQDPEALKALRLETRRLISERMIELYEPYPKQAAFHAFGKTMRERLLMASNQTGKALRNGTDVLTPTGWAPIEDLAPGDRVIGGDGNPCTVLGVYPQGPVPLNRLTFDYGQTVDACADHQWRTLTPRARWKTITGTRRDPEPRRRFSQNIPNRKYGVWTVETTSDMRARYGDDPAPVARHVTPHVGVVAFDPRPVPVDPYLLGLLLGDGGLTSAVSFSTRDEPLLKALEAALPEGLSARHVDRCDYRITGGQRGGTDNPLMTSLRGLGLMGKGSHEKRVPHDYLWNSPTVRLAVLQGLMDTDGTCGAANKNGTGGQTTFTSTSPGLTDDVAFLARSFGAKVDIKSRITTFRNKNNELTNGRRSYMATIRLPHVPLFRLDRKQSRTLRPTSTTDNHVLMSFADAPPGPATCIAVDSPDNTYVVEGFIVTHNTYSASAEMSYHLTGLYPDWWQGRTFTDPIAAWAIGVSSELTRDSCQRLLFGRASNPGTGLVPRRLIQSSTAARGVAEAFDTVTVKHASGGNSTVGFKSYQQDRTKLQAETLDVVWMDEEPPYPLYSEAVTRTNASNGMIMLTFTPLEGMSEVVRLFYPKPTTQDRVLIQMTIDDAAHFSVEQRKRIVAFYKPHEREARTRGIPQLGSGKVFAVPEDAFVIEAFQIPRHWPRLMAIDLGFDHPFGAVNTAHDKDADCVYVTHALAVTQHTVAQHSAILKGWGPMTPVAWPHDAASHDRMSGEPIAELYRKQGLKMCFEHATFPEGGFGLEASIADMIDRFESGRLKIFSHLSDLLEELRNYHRKDGRPVKQHDDVISALRYALMMLRFARVPSLGSAGAIKRGLRMV